MVADNLTIEIARKGHGCTFFAVNDHGERFPECTAESVQEAKEDAKRIWSWNELNFLEVD